MRIALGLAAACLSTAALAAPPPTQPGYQINLGIGASSPSFAYGQVPMWIDTTNTTVSPIGLPRPVSAEYPLPVSIASGAAGSSTTTPSYSKPSPVNYGAANASAISTANQAVTVFAAGSVTTGCYISNPVGNAVLYVDLVTTAQAGLRTSIPVLPGQQFTCPAPPNGAVSAVAAQTQPFVAMLF